jgi:hypothetical protein
MDSLKNKTIKKNSTHLLRNFLPQILHTNGDDVDVDVSEFLL